MIKSNYFTDLCHTALQVATEKGFSVTDISHGTLFALMLSEASEALEAHRDARFASMAARSLMGENAYIDAEFFKKEIKDTVGDELADVVIRFAHYFGYLMSKDQFIKYNGAGIRSLNYDAIMKGRNFDFGDAIIRLNRIILQLHDYFLDRDTHIMQGNTLICEFLGTVSAICMRADIPLEDHIEWKLSYNRTRQHKHGKRY